MDEKFQSILIFHWNTWIKKMMKKTEIIYDRDLFIFVVFVKVYFIAYLLTFCHSHKGIAKRKQWKKSNRICKHRLPSEGDCSPYRSPSWIRKYCQDTCFDRRWPESKKQHQTDTLTSSSHKWATVYCKMFSNEQG